MNQSVRKSAPSGALPAPPLKAVANVSPLLVTLRDPLSSAAESIRAVRTHVLSQHIQLGRRALAVCAASEGVGCSFVASNLAVALAQVGVKTLLVDGDLRSPQLDKIIPPVIAGRGLADALAGGRGGIGDYIEADVLPNLSVLYAGTASSNAQELLALDRFEDLMRQGLRDYEMTIVDTPPANICADVRRISNVVGYSLIVARRNKSLVSDIKTLVGQLIEDHARIVGTVMNSD